MTLLRLASGVASAIAAPLRRKAPTEADLRRTRVPGGWGMDESGPRGHWHGPPEDGDTCPLCGSGDIGYVPGFAEGAENECRSCGLKSFYLY